MKSTMTSPPPLRVVAVSGGLHRPSKASLLAEHLLGLISAEVPCERQTIALGELAADFAGVVSRTGLPTTVANALALVEQADVLVVATPVYRGSYTGLFKHFFDFVDQDALIDTPVLLAATGGSERHSLMIDHQLRPLFSFFQARTLPLGVYATDQDFSGHALDSAGLLQRARLAVERALPLLEVSGSRDARADGRAAAA